MAPRDAQLPVTNSSWIWGVLLSVMCGALASAQAVAAGAPDAPQVTVHENQGVFTVTARFQVPQSPSTALAVLTDYEQIPRFMPGVTSSIVRERSAGRVVVEQEAVSRMMMFSKRIRLLLEVEEQGVTIAFRDFAGRSFDCYEGTWRLAEQDGQTVITYELHAKPTFDVPDFLLARLLRRDARQMIQGLRAEIAARPAVR